MSDNAFLINAITGEKITTDVKFFMSLDEFRDFISQKWRIPSEQLLILLPFGNKLKSSGFRECLRSNTLDENEFYIYDRRLFSIIKEPLRRAHDSEALQDESYKKAEVLLSNLVRDTLQKRESALLKPINSPLADADLRIESLNARSITSLLTTNLGWLSALEIDVHYFRNLMSECAAQTSEILRCLSVCEQYLRLYCYDVEKLYNSNVEFLNQLAQNGQSSKWKECYNQVLHKLQGIEGSLERYVDLKTTEQNENSIKLLDQSINSKLKKVKRDLDKNADLRAQITEAIALLQNNSTLKKMKDNLEETMLTRFDEIVEETRRRSRDFLEQDSIDSFNDGMEDIHSFLLNTKNEVSGKLFTIAQALYAQSEQVIERKHKLQINAILLLGQIAFVQVETIGIKRKLLNECNKDLDLYQKNEIQFAKIEDIPLIYGLFLVEKYRRESWILQVLSQTRSLAGEYEQIRNKEQDHRTKWTENFGSTASLFCRNLENFTESEKIEELFLNDVLSHERQADEKVISVRHSLNKTRELIDEYIAQLRELKVGDNVSELISQSFSEAKSYQVTIVRVRDSKESSTSASNQINGYRARIKKLESLLHDARYSNPGHWPSGILNTTFITPFHNSVTTVSSKMSSSSLLETDRNLNVANVIEVENKLKNLQQINEKLRRDGETKDMHLSVTKSKITDLELETMAFKETMTYLNKELARLTDEEEKSRFENINQQNSFKQEMEAIIRENSKLFSEFSRLKHRTEVDDTLKREAMNQAKKLDEELGQERRTLQEKTVAFEEEISKLNERLTLLEEENKELKEKKQVIQEVEDEQKELTPPTDLAKESEKEENLAELRNQNRDTEATIYEVFASDVFILENIGLLLSLDENNRIIIKRVKGLRRGQSQGVLDDSIQISEADVLVKSTIYRDVKKMYDEVHNTDDMDKHKSLFEEVRKLYDNKLYETAVIRRFKDIETLAKKLTKENKKKRGQLESYQNERLTLKNFQVGDLALFLPTREHNSPTESSVSSLNSSFSSVDLSTPLPFDTVTMHPSSAGKDRISKKSKSRPWAAFTAFDESTRYFLKDENNMIKGKDWFVGKILTMEKFIAEDTNSNPYKLPNGVSWFQVTAAMISCQV